MPLSRQLASELRQALAGGRIGAGARLPSTRSLAAELSIARSTVLAVFEQLAAEGYIEPRQGSGYFVATPLTPHAGLASDNEGVPAARVTSRHAQSLRLVMPDWRKSPELGDPPRQSDSCARRPVAAAIRAATVAGGTR
jgi:DNA-binding GntR family transcriptional regulator